MNKIYQCYDINTGEILCTYNVSPEIAEYMRREQGLHLIEGEGRDDTHYVDISQTPHVLKPKPAQKTKQDKTEITADGQDCITLSGLPVPCNVRIGKDEIKINDGILEWSTLIAGHYEIIASMFPYLDFRSEVNAIEN